MKHFRTKHGAACGASGTTLRLTPRTHLVACKRCLASAAFKAAAREAYLRSLPDDYELEDLGRLANEAAEMETAAEYEMDEHE